MTHRSSPFVAAATGAGSKEMIRRDVAAVNRLGRKQDRYDQVAEAAAPVLDRLCQKVLWPSDLLVPAGDHMDRRESSRPRSPFVTHSPYVMNRVGQPVGWLLTGVGRAYLSFCPRRERESILARLRKSGKPEDRLANDQKKLEKIFAETRQRGYGTRDRIFVGGTYGNPPMNDGLAAIAVPLLDRERVHGSINILWIKTAFTIEEFASRHLSDLQGAAEEIVSALRSSKQSRRPARGFVEN
jgi:IclR family transcriptional regulator, mhp operon transcriptional activator